VNSEEGQQSETWSETSSSNGYDASSSDGDDLDPEEAELGEFLRDAFDGIDTNAFDMTCLF